MKTMFLAAVAAVGLGTMAYAGDGDGTSANTRFTEIPGVVAQAPVQNAPPVATAQNGQATQTNVSGSDRATWVFPPIGKYLAQ